MITFLLSALIVSCGLPGPLPALDEVQEPAGNLADIMLRARGDEQELMLLRQSAPGELSLQRLQDLFSRTADVPVAIESEWTGLRAATIRWLKTAGPETQRLWNRYAAVTAAAKLSSAVAAADERQLTDLSRCFPLTETALQTQSILIVLACLRGDPDTAELRLAQLEQHLSGTFLEPLAAARRPAFRALIESAVQRSHQNNRVTQIPATPQASIDPLPWPQPLWTWKEKVYDLPGLPASDLSRLLLMSAPNPPIRLRQYHRWPATRWHDWVLVRTPARLVALNCADGTEAWSLPALLPDSGLHSHFCVLGQPESPLTPEMLRPTWGRIVTSQSSCFVIDGFAPVQQEGAGNLLNGFPPGNRVTKHKHGSRLISLHLVPGQSLPQIRWAAGTDLGEVLQITQTFPSEANAETESGPNTTESEQSLDGHLFVSLPETVGLRLYVITHSPDFIVLNCLDARSGTVLWQQPVGYLPVDGFPERYRGTTECSASGRSIICTLQTGLLVSVSQLDGSIEWARQLAVDTSALEGSHLLRLQTEPAGQTPDDHQPAIMTSVQNKRIICAEPGQRAISCVDADSGRTLWSVPHAVSGEISRSGQDLQVLFHDEYRLILTGTSHCRSLDPATGRQLWQIFPGYLCGTGIVSGNYCLLPLRGTGVAAVDIRTGQELPGYRLTLPVRMQLPAGACSVDRLNVFSATSGSVTAWPTAGHMLRSPPGSIPADQMDDEVSLQSALAESLLSRTAPLVARSSSLRAARREDAASAVDMLQVDLLLESLVDELQSPSPDAGKAEAVIEQINSLKPDPQRLHRTFMLARLLGLSAADVGYPNQARSFRPTLLPVARNWLVSPSAWPVTAAAFDQQHVPQPKYSAELVEAAILHPQMLQDSAGRLDLLQYLQAAGMADACDVWGCAWLRFTINTNPDETRFARNALRTAREQLRQTASLRSAPPNQKQRTVSGWRFVPEIHPLPLPQPEAQNSAPEPVENLPPWLKLRVSISGGTDDAPAVIQTTDETGDVLSALPLESIGQKLQLQLPRAPDDSAPGLMTLAFRNRLTAIHLAPTGQLNRLWTAPTRRSPDSDEPILPGPIIAGRVYWLQGDSLHCSHALTGRDIWRRTGLAVREDLSFAFNSADHLPLFGDDSAIILFDPFAGTRTAWDAKTGKLVSEGQLHIGLGNRPVSCGRFLIASSETGRLLIIDGVTGIDLLADQPEVSVPPLLIHRFCCLLSGNRLLAAAGSQGLIAVDLNTGRVQFRTDDPRLEFPASDLHAFESDGGLYVLLRDWDRLPEHAGIMTSPAMSRLLRIDPVTGTVLWSTDTVSFTEMHRPSGGNSGVFVLLKSVDESKRMRQASIVPVDVSIRVLSDVDGTEVAATSDIPLTFPVTVVRTADDGCIRIRAAGGGVKITPEPTPD